MTNISFEFFPTKTKAGHDKLMQVARQLAKWQPDYFSVTYGAGGTTREGTLNTVQAIKQAGYAVAPHLSCIGSSKTQIQELISQYQALGISRLVALRGDLPSGTHDSGDFQYASELVRFIREYSGDAFHIEVAAYPEFHPQAHSAREDFAHFVEKMQAGANAAITQYFYTVDAYRYFLEDCQKAGIQQPIIPGIMPIINFQNLERFSRLCGAEIPLWLKKRLQDLSADPDALKAFGLEVVTDLCRQLLDAGAPGLHFYTMNQAQPTLQILQNLFPERLISNA